jgi:urocanate hydratase
MASGITGCSGMIGMGTYNSFTSTGHPQFSGTSTSIQGIAGVTGMMGTAPICGICKKMAHIIHRINENLDHVNQDGYIVCKKCLTRTERLLKIIDKIDPIKLPLYVSHSNELVRIRVSKRLESS